MFKIGEYVSYRAEGVCVISDIRTESFNALGKCEEYYILSPIKDMNSVLYVPVNNELLTSKMLKLLSADEICALADSLRGERLEWVNESRARTNGFREILATGDRRSLIVLVNTVSEHIEIQMANGKKPTAGDENALKRAKRMLLDEFSATTDLKSEEELMLMLCGEHRCSAKEISKELV